MCGRSPSPILRSGPPHSSSEGLYRVYGNLLGGPGSTPLYQAYIQTWATYPSAEPGPGQAGEGLRWCWEHMLQGELGEGELSSHLAGPLVKVDPVCPRCAKGFSLVGLLFWVRATKAQYLSPS